MARLLRIEYPGAVYHVTNRGNDKKAVFKDDQDRETFLKVLPMSIDDTHCSAMRIASWIIIAIL